MPPFFLPARCVRYPIWIATDIGMRVGTTCFYPQGDRVTIYLWYNPELTHTQVCDLNLIVRTVFGTAFLKLSGMDMLGTCLDRSSLRAVVKHRLPVAPAPKQIWVW